jgi:protein-S-isoprenylcysteine O-methyltransferase Ste14
MSTGHRQLAVDTAQSAAQSDVSPELHRLLWSSVWDVAMRAMGLLWTGFLLWTNVIRLMAFIEARHVEAMSAVVFVTAVAARVAFIAFLLLLVSLFVVRFKPLAKAPGLNARVVALLGSFLPTFFGVFLPRYEESALLNLTSLACLAVGNGLSAYGFTYLNRSASIMAEARRLVTAGPYRFVRHPVYLFEQIAVFGAVLNYMWPPRVALFAVLLFAAHVWCQFQRMRNEEGVLEATFPEYTEYKRRTARLLPGLY